MRTTNSNIKNEAVNTVSNNSNFTAMRNQKSNLKGLFEYIMKENNKTNAVEIFKMYNHNEAKRHDEVKSFDELMEMFSALCTNYTFNALDALYEIHPKAEDLINSYHQMTGVKDFTDEHYACVIREILKPRCQGQRESQFDVYVASPFFDNLENGCDEATFFTLFGMILWLELGDKLIAEDRALKLTLDI